jgi:hypothetical protein
MQEGKSGNGKGKAAVDSGFVSRVEKERERRRCHPKSVFDL